MNTNQFPTSSSRALDVATWLATEVNGLRDDVNALVAALADFPDEVLDLCQHLLWLAVEADRIEANAYDGDKLEYLDDLLNEGESTGLLQEGDVLDLLELFLAVGATRGGLCVDVDQLGNVDRPQDLLRPLCAVLVVRLDRLATALASSRTEALTAVRQDLDL